MSEMFMELEGHSGAVMGRFSLRGGEHAGRVRDLVCPVDGSVEAIIAEEGAAVIEGSVACRIGSCRHDESFNNICSNCGEVLDDASAAGGDSLRRTQMERLNHLLSMKKLALVLDLDHTLLHTTLPKDQTQTGKLQRIKSGLEGTVHAVTVNDYTYYTKLRPHLRSFLAAMAEMFELYVYTAGDRAYAESIAKVLDESGRWFSGRIVSRDDYADVPAEHKKLNKIFPIDEHWATALILDDNCDTWDHPSDARNPRENLIHVVKYNFWPRNVGETHNPVNDGAAPPIAAALDSEAGDLSAEELPGEAEFDALVRKLLEADALDRHLLHLQGLLTRVHTQFFGGDWGEVQEASSGAAVGGNRDVRVLIRQQYARILKGSALVFSGVFHTGTVPEHGREWKAAESMGAMCDKNIAARTTHLVYVSRGEGGVTDKVVEAVHRGGVQVVSPEWVQACRSAWEKVDEELFRPRNWEAIRQEAEARAGRAAKKRKMGELTASGGHKGEGGGAAQQGGAGGALMQEVMGLVGDVEAVLSKGVGEGGDVDAGGSAEAVGAEGEADMEDELAAALEEELEHEDGSESGSGK